MKKIIKELVTSFAKVCAWGVVGLSMFVLSGCMSSPELCSPGIDEYPEYFTTQKATESYVSNMEYETEIVEVYSSCTELTPAHLDKVVDGDTIWVTVAGSNESKKVRLIGMNTPESVHANEAKNSEYGIIASNYTKKLLADVNTVYLQYDIDNTDQYGRILAYVWLNNTVKTDDRTDIYNNMLNAILIRDGYAVAKTYSPNVKYQNKFAEIQYEAETDVRGIWKYAYWD